MGSWWSGVEEKGLRKVILIGCKGAGKSHFIECFEQVKCGVKPTKLIKKFMFEHNNVELNFNEIGSVYARNERCLKYLGKGNDCVYFFLDATESVDSLFDSKQLLLETLVKLPSRAPICIILNIRSPEKPSFTFEDVERTFQLHLLAENYSILLVKLTFKTDLPVRYMFDWTINNSQGHKKETDD